jgi:hypothetical protein
MLGQIPPSEFDMTMRRIRFAIKAPLYVLLGGIGLATCILGLWSLAKFCIWFAQHVLLVQW